MPVIEFKSKQGKGWQPLPEATYDFQIVSVDPTKTSKKGNPQMMIEAKVISDQHTDKKSTLWYPLDGAAAWRTRNLLEATGVDHEEYDSGEVDDEGQPMPGYRFESDDLIGATFRADVTQREFDKKINNDFTNERPIDEAAATKPAAAPAAASSAPARTPSAAAAAAAPAPAVAAAAAAGVRRPRA